MKVTTLGIDLAKSIFPLHGVDAHGKVATRKRVTRSKLWETVAQLPSCVIGMEACGSAQYWAREFQQLGHTVKLISPRFVKPSWHACGSGTAAGIPGRHREWYIPSPCGPASADSPLG